MVPPSSINYGSIGGEVEEPRTAETRRKSFRMFKLSDIQKINTHNVRTIQTRTIDNKIDNIKSFCSAQFDNVKRCIEVVWLLVEMHTTKFILIYGFYLAVHEVSVLHIAIVVLTAAACASRSHLQTVFSRLISLVIGVLLILKMIYQIQYIDQSLTTVDCSVSIYSGMIWKEFRELI